MKISPGKTAAIQRDKLNRSLRLPPNVWRVRHGNIGNRAVRRNDKALGVARQRKVRGIAFAGVVDNAELIVGALCIVAAENQRLGAVRRYHHHSRCLACRNWGQSQRMLVITGIDNEQARITHGVGDKCTVADAAGF